MLVGLNCAPGDAAHANAAQKNKIDCAMVRMIELTLFEHSRYHEISCSERNRTLIFPAHWGTGMTVVRHARCRGCRCYVSGVESEADGWMSPRPRMRQTSDC